MAFSSGHSKRDCAGATRSSRRCSPTEARSTRSSSACAPKWPRRGFLAGKALAANQIEFVDLIVNHLTEHGVMEAAMLYESPFTDLTPRGPDEIFSSEQVDELVRVLDTARSMAIAA